jgi:plasmid replication initiation protein
MAAFWVVAPCSLAEVYQYFRGNCASIITAMMEAASTSETSVTFYQTAIFILAAMRTNTSRDTRVRRWKYVTACEIKTFIACLVNMHTIKSQHLQSYWYIGKLQYTAWFHDML